MSNQKKVLRLIKKANKQEQLNLANWGKSVEQVREQKKQNDLIKPTHVELFERLKTNLIIFDKLDNVEGFAQLIKRKLMRFDVAKFKELNPEEYTKYLVPMDTIEIKIKLQSRGN